MCIVVDACVFAHLFNPDNEHHEDFVPLLNWIMSGDGKLVTGGTKYAKELHRLPKILRLFVELQKVGKVCAAEAPLVDAKENALKKSTPKNFNDEHLIAILAVTGCLLISTVNKSDMAEMKNRKHYPGRRIPKIYNRKSHQKLLCKKNIAAFCTN